MGYGHGDMMYTVHVQDVPASTTAVIRSQVRQSDLSKVVPAQCGEVWAFTRAAGLVPRPGRHVAVYLDSVNGAVTLECGVEVFAPFAGNDRVVQSATPAGRVAKTAHIGPYAGLGGAHQAILEWCKSNGRALAGPSWEIYGHWTDDASRLRTDVYYLLA